MANIYNSRPQTRMEKFEDETQKVSDELKINLPGQGLFLPLRLIALFTLVGGLSIVGSAFANIVDSSATHIGIYILRLITGALALTSAYGIIERKRWALWSYGAIVLIGIYYNPVVTILPAVAFVYMYSQRQRFTMSILDYKLVEVIAYLKSLLRRQG